MQKNLYYSVCNLHLSGREYIELETFKDGTKLIKFPSFANQTITAFPIDLDETQKIECEKNGKKKE